MTMPLDIGYTRRYTAYIYHIHAYITGVAMSTKQLLINTNEDSDLPYKGELRFNSATNVTTFSHAGFENFEG
jgi:hypothetical protein